MSATKTFNVSNDINITINKNLIGEQYDFEKGTVYALKQDNESAAKALKGSVVMEYIDANGETICEWLNSVYEAAAKFSWALGAIKVESIAAIQERMGIDAMTDPREAGASNYEGKLVGELPEGFDYTI